MSKELSSVLATRRVSAASRLTPRLILPDLTITALLAASLILASSAALKPVVPMMCTLRPLAASAAKATVADGAVKSIMPSALSSSGPASPLSLTPFSGVPASVPASQPISGERASSSAPLSAKPLMSTIALTSVRPIRPPAPATTSRISAMGLTPGACGVGIARRRAKGTTAAGRRSPRSRSNRRRRWPAAARWPWRIRASGSRPAPLHSLEIR